MCGIIAAFGLERPLVGSQKEVSKLEQQLNDSLLRIAHRGPDGQGTWIDPKYQCALGHVRLSINDLSDQGHQPLHSPADDVHAVVNGELYDYDILRQSILDNPRNTYTFHGHSDSELVIALYLLYGTAFLSQLRGEFAIVIYDSRAKLLIAARDRYGIKPLFWTRSQGRLLLAAEVKGLLGMGWEPKWDVQALVDGGWGQDTRTVFKGVQKVRPGHYLLCRPGSEIESRQYWDAVYPDKNTPETRSEADMIGGLRELMLDSVRARLRADVPVGIYLSGGIDSSAIAGIATHLVKTEGLSMGSEKVGEEGKICCFSIGFDEESGFDESAISERTANWLGVKFLKKHMNETELANSFEDAVYHIEHHNHDLNFVGKYALSELPREHGYKVVLTGEGADEHFGGYPIYLPDFLREEDKTFTGGALELNEKARDKTTSEQEKVISDLYETMSGTSKYCGNKSGDLNGLALPGYMLAFTPSLDLFSTSVKQSFGDIDTLSTVSNNIDERTKQLIRTKWHPLHSAMYVWGKGHLSNQFLSCLGDRVEMAHSVEARTPFLDHHLTEYVNTLPPTLKIRYSPNGGDAAHIQNGDSSPADPKMLKQDFIEKFALREAVKPYIPDEIYTRRKHAYAAPISFPQNGPIHRVLEKYITQDNIEQLGFLDWPTVKQFWDVAFGEAEEMTVEAKGWCWRNILVIAEWVVLAQRFGIKTAVIT